jgi:hypothetical protein
MVTIPGSAASNPICGQCQLFKKFKYKELFKIKDKPDPALFGTLSFQLIKKRIAKSRETVPLTLNFNRHTVT